MEKPDATAILTAAHLERLEEVGVALEAAMARGETPTMPEETAPVTRMDALDSITRIRFHQDEKARVEAEATAMIAPLLAQIDQIRAWAKEQAEYRDARIRFHEGRLSLFYHLNPPASGKTLKLPGGEIAERTVPPKWDYTDEGLLLVQLETVDEDLIRTKRELDKNALKQRAEVRDDGSVAVDGVILEGVRVVPQPPVMKVTLK